MPYRLFTLYIWFRKTDVSGKNCVELTYSRQDLPCKQWNWTTGFTFIPKACSNSKWAAIAAKKSTQSNLRFPQKAKELLELGYQSNVGSCCLMSHTWHKQRTNKDQSQIKLMDQKTSLFGKGGILNLQFKLSRKDFMCIWAFQKMLKVRRQVVGGLYR